MIPAITYNFLTGTQFRKKWAPDGSGTTGFQTASASVDFHGDGDAFAAAFPIGGKAPKGTAMYYSGVQIEDESDGWTTGTVFAKGFWTAAPPSIDSLSSDISKRLWPFTNGGVNYFLPGTSAGKATALNPLNGNTYYRIQQILEKATISRTGYLISTNLGATLPAPPKPTEPRPNFLGSVPNGLKDPLLSTETGWVRQGGNSSPEVLGSIALITWTDRWEWIDKESE